MEESHPGWRRRAEAPLGEWGWGEEAHLMNASGLGRGEWKGAGQEEEMGGMKETQGGRSKGSHAAWDKSLLLFQILSQPIGVC